MGNENDKSVQLGCNTRYTVDNKLQLILIVTKFDTVENSYNGNIAQDFFKIHLIMVDVPGLR